MPQQITIERECDEPGNPPNRTVEPAGRDNKHSRTRTVVLLSVLLALLGLMLGFTTNFIPSNSMEPTLNPGDHILTMRRWLAYPFGNEPVRGDIIVFKLLSSRVSDADSALGVAPDKDGAAPAEQVLIKRVIATGGDKVRVNGNKIFINGVELHEEYKLTPVNDPDAAVYEYADGEDYKVQKGQLFVLGDNRNTSEDSRFWGPLDTKDVLGRFVRVLYNEGKYGPNVLRDRN
jgi:signal peptidase I